MQYDAKNILGYVILVALLMPGFQQMFQRSLQIGVVCPCEG